MKFQVVIIDEPININEPIACELWQKTLWAKYQGYQSNYKAQVLPLNVDDFFATHLIVTNELTDGTLDPVVMYKSIRKSQADRFKVPFGGISLLNSTPYKNDEGVLSIINSPGDISYDSSWTINPKYKGDKEFSLLLRDFVTMFCCRHHQLAGFSRWLTGGAKQFKIDNYFEWLGGKQILPEFSLEAFDNQKVRLFYMPNTHEISDEVRKVADRMDLYWKKRIVFAPKDSVIHKAA